MYMSDKNLIVAAFGDSSLIDSYIAYTNRFSSIDDNDVTSRRTVILHPHHNIVRVDYSRSNKIDDRRIVLVRWLIQKDPSCEPIGYYDIFDYRKRDGYSNTGYATYNPYNHNLTLVADYGEYSPVGEPIMRNVNIMVR